MSLDETRSSTSIDLSSKDPLENPINKNLDNSALEQLVELLNNSEKCKAIISATMLSSYSLEMDAFQFTVDEVSSDMVVSITSGGETFTDTLDPLCVALLLATKEVFQAIESGQLGDSK